MKMEPQSHKDHKGVGRDLSVENPVSKIIVDCAYHVHKKIGPGLLENVYEECMEREFVKRGVSFSRQKELPVYYEGEKLKTAYRVDFLVKDLVIVELKSVEAITNVHEAQTLTYLKLSGLKMALLINFTAPLIKQGIKRFVL